MFSNRTKSAISKHREFGFYSTSSTMSVRGHGLTHVWKLPSALYTPSQECGYSRGLWSPQKTPFKFWELPI